MLTHRMVSIFERRRVYMNEENRIVFSDGKYLLETIEFFQLRPTFRASQQRRMRQRGIWSSLEGFFLHNCTAVSIFEQSFCVNTPISIEESIRLSRQSIN